MSKKPWPICWRKLRVKDESVTGEQSYGSFVRQMLRYKTQGETAPQKLADWHAQSPWLHHLGTWRWCVNIRGNFAARSPKNDISLPQNWVQGGQKLGWCNTEQALPCLSYHGVELPSYRSSRQKTHRWFDDPSKSQEWLLSDNTGWAWYKFWDKHVGHQGQARWWDAKILPHYQVVNHQPWLPQSHRTTDAAVQPSCR